MATRLNCPYLSILPQGFRQPPAEVPIKYATYAALTASFASYSAVLTAEATYEDLLVGHPGFEGGVPPLPVGTGVEWGMESNGVEWWLTDVEGVEGSAVWTPRVEEPAVGDGTWLLEVRAPGRQMTVSGVLYADAPVSLGRAIADASAALAAPPRTGWLTTLASDGIYKRIAVALDGATRIKRKGATLAEVQMSVRGIDVGSPGAGAHMEGMGIQAYAPTAQDQFVEVDGAVPTPPYIVIEGPVDAGAVVTLGDHEVTVEKAVLAAQKVRIDCRQRLVLVNDVPDRSLISLKGGRWPLLPVGAVNVKAVYAGGGKITVEAVPLW